MATALMATAQPLLAAKPLSFHPHISARSHPVSHGRPLSLSLSTTHFQRKPRTKATFGFEAAVALTHKDDGASEATIVDSQISLYDSDEVVGGAFEVDQLGDDFGRLYAVPKKRTSKSKKNIRKNFWFRKGNVAAKKALSLAKSILSGKSKSFMYDVEKPEED
nr:chloroplast ribosomal protein L32 [Hypericum ascyron]